MMIESEQLNPYESPQASALSQRSKYFIYGSIIAVILFFVAATAFMAFWAFSSAMLDRGNPNMNRGPVPPTETKSPAEELPPQTLSTVGPESEAP